MIYPLLQCRSRQLHFQELLLMPVLLLTFPGYVACLFLLLVLFVLGAGLCVEHLSQFDNFHTVTLEEDPSSTVATTAQSLLGLFGVADNVVLCS